MRQAEIQIGGTYISKGIGMRQGRRVQVIALMPAAGGHPAKVKLKDLDSGRITNPNVTSFQNSYAVESLPQKVTNLKKRIDLLEVRGEPEGLRDGLVELKALLKMALSQVEKVERTLEG